MNTFADATLTEEAFNGILAYFFITGVILLFLALLGVRASGGARGLAGLVGAALAGYAAFVYLSNGDTVLLGGKLMVLPPIAIICMIVAIIKGRGGKEQPAQWAPQQQVPQQQWPAAAQQSHPHGAMPPQQQWGAPQAPHQAGPPPPPQWGAPQAPQPGAPQAPQQYPPAGYGYPPPQYRR